MTRATDLENGSTTLPNKGVMETQRQIYNGKVSQ